ncbi:hypothetical protein CPB84DRAFT_1684681 [Gymnopilus junonius]|uniref:Uncharacterized protein n=1 Tax=Gymnopilus junonius TaxID=109634 RepID=A0A9P5NGZ0_GYMJU|nr:hypothetical protein CPB84DRAFT_1684681 [Gymnopilus junonius]
MADKKRKQDGTLSHFVVKKAKVAQDAAPGFGASKDTTEGEGGTILDAAARLAEFQALLDFSLVDSEEEIARRLQTISKTLLHGFKLVVKPDGSSQEIEFQVMEAEFYLQIDGLHEDPFTHGSEEQKFSGQWYFHRAPRFSKDSHRSLTSATEYRDGSRKGLDITLGALALNTPTSEESRSDDSRGPQSRRGGILLRSLREVNNKAIISGPSLLVDRLLSASGVATIKELVETKWNGDISAFRTPSATSQGPFLYLKPALLKSSTIYFSPRIGLELSHPGTTSVYKLPLHPRIRFLPKRYRFFGNPELLVSKGRPQTFLGILQSRLSSHPNEDAGLRKPSLAKEISRLMALKEPTAVKYLADYMEGRNGGEKLVDSFIGAKGKGASGSPATYLKMMGAISNLEV